MATNTINLSPAVHTSSSLRLLSSYSPQNAHNLSVNSHFKPSIQLPSVSYKPYNNSIKPRSLIITASAVNSLSESESVAVPSTAEEVTGKLPSESGVYAVYDGNDLLQFIGISRNIAASVFAHLKSVPELCSSIKVGVVADPDRSALTEAWKSWMEEHIKATGKVPPGNESGNTTWVRQPPRKKKPDLRLTPGRNVQLTVPLEELINKLVKENKVVAFIKGSRSAPLCGFSQRVIGILESEGVNYESVDVLDEEYNYGLRETLKKYSNWPTLPQIFVNGELVGGCDILSSMHEKGNQRIINSRNRDISNCSWFFSCIESSTKKKMEEIESSPSSPSSSSGRFKLYDQLKLQEFKDKYVIRSVESPDHGFMIGRRDGNLELLNDENCTGNPLRTSTIYGVAGTIRLLAGTYLLVITSQKEVGTFLGFPVFRVMSMRFLSCNEDLRFSTSQEKKDEAYFMSLLKIVEGTPGLYYSYATDITLNLQRRFKLAEGWTAKPIWKQADPRFVWNKNLLEELIECKLDGFVLPLLKLKDSLATITLISRRCTRRLGTRMWRRGANFEGDTANSIETEQLFEIEGFRSSFLQFRGSIPLLWEQIVDLSYKPQLKIINNEQTPRIVERHFQDLLQRYGDIVAVDLTDKHGDEGRLSAAYAAEMQKLPNVRYEPFDFHNICGNSNFDNLKVLYDQISEEFENQGYFFIDTEGNILQEQKGIIRSNCIDCLDRTNVTQSYLAQKSLTLQLQRIGVLTSTECVSMFSEEYAKFRTLWAEQGDEISIEYAGTHALKGDLVRYGKQTVSGMIKDGMSALSRYYLNNFHDGIRQDALDLISGHYAVNKNRPSPFQLNGFELFSYLPVASALLIGGLTMTSFTVQQVGRNTQQYLSSVLWAGVTAGVVAVIKANGRQFCSRPRLCNLR
ncbi:hypothetical protein QYF36_007355 [Acer negundo]|nr:hypothetical protein QYF36_007355 [Acer negundo]